MYRRTLVRIALVAGFMMATASGAAAHEGWGIVVDARGRVYVADIPANTIWRISPDGRVEALARGIHSHALSLGADGSVYGTHVSLTEPVRGVWRLDESGRFTDIIPGTRDFPLGLQSFLRAPDGSIYSASAYQHPEPAGGRELYLLRWSPDGRIDTVAGGPTAQANRQGRWRGLAARFENIDGMAWMPDGRIVLADGEYMRWASIEGEVTSVNNQLSRRRWGEDLLGMAVGPDSAIYIVDFSGWSVHRIRRGRLERFYWPIIYWSPSGVFATADAVYVLEHPRSPFGILGDLAIGPYLRVRKLAADGGAVTLTTQWGRHTSWVLVILLLILAARPGIAWLRRRASANRVRSIPEAG